MRQVLPRSDQEWADTGEQHLCEQRRGAIRNHAYFSKKTVRCKHKTERI